MLLPIHKLLPPCVQFSFASAATASVALRVVHVALHVLLPMRVRQCLAIACVTAGAMVHMLLHSGGVADACAAAFCW